MTKQGKSIVCEDEELRENKPENMYQYEETYNFIGQSWEVSAQFNGEDSEERKLKAQKIVRQAENELDALIIQKRAELEAKLCLICNNLEID